jgi:hypothetical protein
LALAQKNACAISLFTQLALDFLNLKASVAGADA